MSYNNFLVPAKDFVSSNVSGHLNCIFARFWAHSQESSMDPEQMSWTNHFISHLWNTKAFERVVKTLVRYRKFWEFDLNIRLHFITSLKKFCPKPSDKKQKQNKTKALAKKFISPCLQYSANHQKRRRKCPSGFKH